MKLFLTIIALVLAINTFAQIDLTSGGAGYTMPNQSYNESRGIDITVISSSMNVTAVTLKRFNTWAAKAFIGLRVYNSTTHALLFKRDSIIASMHDGSLTIPASFMLEQGQSYRVCFYCIDYPNTSNTSSAYVYVPTFPYVESSNLIRINEAYQSNLDQFPENKNLCTPFISLEYTPLGIDEFKTTTPLIIYPNPFSIQTTIKTDRILNKATLTVFNSLGQIVKQVNNIAGQSIVFHRDDLPAGIYNLVMKQGQEIIVSGKVIIME